MNLKISITIFAVILYTIVKIFKNYYIIYKVLKKFRNFFFIMQLLGIWFFEFLNKEIVCTTLGVLRGGANFSFSNENYSVNIFFELFDASELLVWILN